MEPEIEAVRRSVLKDCVDDATLDEAFSWSPRTKARHIAAGLPFIKLGALRLYHLPSVNQWVLAQTRSYKPRGRGRPRTRGGAKEARTAPPRRERRPLARAALDGNMSQGKGDQRSNTTCGTVMQQVPP